jgi:hypothetical protein
MMRFAVLLICLFSIACSETSQQNDASSAVDTMITLPEIRRIVNDNTSRLQRNVKYEQTLGELHFAIEAGEREDSSIALRMNFYSTLTFEAHLQHQQNMLHEVAKDFDLQRTTSIFLGRLVYTGDLALRVSKQLEEANWDGNRKELQTLLEKSAVVKAYQEMLTPFGMNIKGVSFEKVMHMDKESLLNFATITVPDSEQPEQVVDCMLWLIL